MGQQSAPNLPANDKHILSIRKHISYKITQVIETVQQTISNLIPKYFLELVSNTEQATLLK
jgi:hypothetical protein